MNPNTYSIIVKALHKSLYLIVLPILLASCGSSSPNPPSPPTLDAPDLADALEQTYLINQPITALSFSNAKGAVASCNVADANPLPQGLDVAVANNTCQIEGTPTEPSGKKTYTIIATNDTGSVEATVDITVFAPVTISEVTLSSSGAQTTPQLNDTLTLEFTTTPQPNFAPQVRIGGQPAVIVQGQGAMAGDWTATVTVGPSFVLDDQTQSFVVIIVVPKGTSPTEDLRQSTTVTAVQNTPAPLTLTDTTETILLTPLLALDTTSYSFEVEQRITPITFTNNGGEVQASGCSASPTLPIGLSFVVTEGTCRIEGRPTVVTDGVSHTITASNASGMDMGATVTIAVVASTKVVNLVILDSAGIATGNTLSYTYSTDGSFSTQTTTSSTDNAGGTKLNWSETGGVITVNYLAVPGVGRFVNQFDADPTTSPAATMDLSAYAQGNLIFDINVPSYGTYTNMIVKVDSPPSCDCNQVFGKVGEGFWQTISIPISDFPTTGNNPLDLTQVSANFIIWPDATVQQTQAMLTFMLRNIRWEPLNVPAPILADNTDANVLILGLGFAPITFANSGEAAISCSVDTTTTPALPQGLEVEAMGDTCQITGTPGAEATLATYTIVAASANGQTDSATVDITVGTLPTTPPGCAHLEKEDVAGYPVTVTGESERLYVRGNLSNGRSHPNFIFRYKGNNIYQASLASLASFDSDNTLAAQGYDPASTEFRVAADDDSLSTQFNVIDDSTLNIVTTPLNLNQRYLVDRSDGQRLSGNNLVALQASEGYVFTLELDTADAANGASVGELYIQGCTQFNSAPVFVKIDSLMRPLMRTLILNRDLNPPITFMNRGGNVQEGSCASSNLPAGLAVANSPDNRTCQITGTPGMVSSPTEYTITAENASGSDTVTITIDVIDPTGIADFDLLSSSGLGAAISANNIHSPGGTFLDGDRMVSQDANNGPKLTWSTASGVIELIFANSIGASFWSLGFSPTTNPPTSQDLSRYAPGFIAFDVMVSDYGNTLSLLFQTDSNPTCALCEKDLGKVGDGFWQTIAVEIAEIAEIEGFDLTTMTSPFTISPDIASQTSQRDLSLMVRNIRLTNTEPPIPDPPALANADDQVYAINDPVSLDIANANGNPGASQCRATPTLPGGLDVVVSSGTCQITGTPTRKRGAQTYTITASNLGGQSEATVVITVNVAAPDLPDTSLPTMAISGTAIATITLVNSGGGELTDCVFFDSSDNTEKETLGGLTVAIADNGDDCEVDGAPSSAQNLIVTVRAKNITRSDDTTILFTVSPAAPDLGPGLTDTVTSGTAFPTITVVNSGGGELTHCVFLDANDNMEKEALGGLTIAIAENRDDCEVDGTLSNIQTFTATVLARNITNSDETTITFAVNPAAPDLRVGLMATVASGAAFPTITVVNSGGGELTHCVFLDSNMEKTALNGLTIAVEATNRNDCEIGGSLSSLQPFTATVLARNITDSDETTITFTLNPAAPNLANIEGEQRVSARQAITTPIVFTNNGGIVPTGGCSVMPALPMGLELTATNGTCQITGISEVTAVSMLYTITATNITGPDPNDATVTLVVNPSRPDLSDTTLSFTAIVDTVIPTFTVVNSGGGELTSCAFVDNRDNTDISTFGRGPLTIAVEATNRNDCEIDGILKTNRLGPGGFRVRARNIIGEDEISISYEVNNATPALADIEEAQVFPTGQTIDPIIFTNEGGNVDPDGCSSNSPLPRGLRIVVGSGTCQIMGIPTEPTTSALYTIRARNVTGQDTATVNIEITTLKTPELDNIEMLQTLFTRQEIPAIIFTNQGDAVDSGSCSIEPDLPRDLRITTVEGTCQITGTPIVVTPQRQYTITAMNFAGSNEATITIVVRLPAPELVDIGGMQSFEVGQEIDRITFTNNGGAVRTNGCVEAPPLPASLSLNAPSGTCQIRGKLTAEATTTLYTITGINDTGQDTATITIEVVSPSAPDLVDIAEPQIYAARGIPSNIPVDPLIFPNNGGFAESCISDTALPMGLILSVLGQIGSDTCRITGVPTMLAEPKSYTITASNRASPGTGTGTATVTIAVVDPSDVPDLVISDGDGLTSGNFYSVVYASSGNFASNFEVSDDPAHRKVQWSTDDEGVTMVEYQPTVGAGRLQITRSDPDDPNSDLRNPPPIHLGNYADGFIVFDIMVPSYGNYKTMLARAESSDLSLNVEEELGQVGAGIWQTVVIDALSRIETTPTRRQNFFKAVTSSLVIYPDEDTQKMSEALSFKLRNIRWTNNRPPPDLVDIAETQIFTIGEEGDPIIFVNRGGTPTLCQYASPQPQADSMVKPPKRLPAGLRLAGTGGTCQIQRSVSGSLEPTASNTYTIEGRNPAGSSFASVTIEVIAAP